MHSSNLRGTDFNISQNGMPVSHSDFFANFSSTRRLGLWTPDGFSGVGAANLVMAFVTAFYDTYRAMKNEFFAYPDYFSFQSCTPLANYAMFDIWPEHKNVYVPPDPVATLNAINDRGINILIVPDSDAQNHPFEPAQLESANRNIDRCFAYSFSGTVQSADLMIESHHKPIVEWSQSIFERGELATNPAVQKHKVSWLAQRAATPDFTQSFRTLTLTEALARL